MQAAEKRVRAAADNARPPSASPTETNPFLTAMIARLAEAQAKLEQARRSGDPDRIAKAEADVAARRSLLPEAAVNTVSTARTADDPTPRRPAKPTRNQWTGPASRG